MTSDILLKRILRNFNLWVVAVIRRDEEILLCNYGAPDP